MAQVLSPLVCIRTTAFNRLTAKFVPTSPPPQIYEKSIFLWIFLSGSGSTKFWFFGALFLYFLGKLTNTPNWVGGVGVPNWPFSIDYAALMGRPHTADKKFVRARGPQNWNSEVFNQTRCSRILHVEFPRNNRELVKAEVFEKRVFEQTTPFKLRKWRGHFPWTTLW